MPSQGLALALALIIRIYDSATIDPDLMLRVRARTEAILESAGVGLQWRSCDTAADEAACGARAAEDEAVVRLLRGPSPVSADACGGALVPARGAGQFISLFVDCLRSAADRLRVAEDVVLGCALAHEIGHLLLGTNSHSSIGLMQAQPRPIDWERAAHGALGFTSEEAVRLRRAVTARISHLAFDAR